MESLILFSLLIIFDKKSLIYRLRMYLLGNTDFLLGLTKIGKTITPTVKKQMGAITINIDSKDMNSFSN